MCLINVVLFCQPQNSKPVLKRVRQTGPHGTEEIAKLPSKVAIVK
jgi:hypothetical protein